VVCGILWWFIPTNHDFAPNPWLEITGSTARWETMALPTNMGRSCRLSSNFYKVLTAGLFLFSSQTKKNWLLTASISNFASPKTPTWAWLVTPSTPRHPQRKGSRPDARLWWHPGGGAMLKSSCLFSDICQPLNYSKFGYIIYIHIGIYWNICSSLNRFLEIHLTWNFMEFSQKYIIFK